MRLPLFPAALRGPHAAAPGFALVVDWFEVWSSSYWRDYLGGIRGRIGALVQRLCALIPQRAFCFSEMHAERLREEGLRGPLTVLRGLYAGPHERITPRPADPVVLFAARLIPEKQASLGVAAMALAARRIEGLRGEFLGDGPDRGALEAAIAEHGLEGIVSAPGFADAQTVDAEMRRALCMLLPSRREGYGMVVVEAAARGTPSVVVAGEDNAATELIVEGVNGTIAERADAEVVAEAIARVHAAGLPSREHRPVVRRKRGAALTRVLAEDSARRLCDRQAAAAWRLGEASRGAGSKRAGVALERQPGGALPGELPHAFAAHRAQALAQPGVAEQSA